MDHPFDMVVFGGSGDLAMGKLLPALYYNCREGQLSAEGRIIAVARAELSREDYLARVEDNLHRRLAPGDFSEEHWRAFAQQLDYLRLDATIGSDYRRLAELLNGGERRVRVFYLATLPEFYSLICVFLSAMGLVTPRSRVVLEKPLGKDLVSAQAINNEVGEVFAERQIFRIDHYLGKETVQNLMALRFGNALFEPLWRGKWISHVQITVAEKIGIEGRGRYYESAGAMRDMVQNHLLQLLCLVAMEPPNSLDPDTIRDEKLKILKALRPLTPESISTIVQGQYRAGAIAGQPVPGYLDEAGVAPGSRTETFVALKAELATWRWAGVPFYLRTGKRMPRQVSEIVVHFHELPHALFKTDSGLIQPNRLVLRLQPEEIVRLYLMAKSPGDGMLLRPVALNLNFADTFESRHADAYERLLMDVIRGKLTLFMRRDELEAAWRWVAPVLDAWEIWDSRPKPYVAGTWGPTASTALITRDGFTWREDGP